MRTPAEPGSSEDLARRRRRRVIWIAVAVSAIVLGAVAAYVAIQPGPPVRLLDVSYSPNPAAPDQPITVTANAQGGSFLAPLSVQVNFESFFGGGASGGAGLFSRGGGTYSGTLGTFSNGTVVWFVVTASDGHELQISDSYTVVVGPVTTGGPSGLRLSSVTLSPPQPTSLDTPVLTINVTSAAAVTDVSCSAMYFYAMGGATSSGGGGGPLYRNPQGNYTTFPWFGLQGSSPNLGTSEGARWLYRVAATDSTGNTVLSPAYNFTVASP